MKFSCTRDNLQRALSLTSHIANKNVNLPILDNVLIRAQEGALRLTTTNLEIAISCTLRGKIEEKGEFTIPSKLFFDYVNLLPNEKIDLDFSEDTVSLSCASDKTKIKGLPAADFPLVPSVNTERSFEIPINAFRQAINRVLFAVTNNEARPELTGIFMKFFPREGKIVLAATDSYRLAESTISFSKKEEEEISVIIPARTMVEVSRVLSIAKDDIEIPTVVTTHLSQNQIVFLCGNTELISRTIEGTYPDYTQIIPTNFQTQTTIDRDDLMKAVKAASLFSKQHLFDVVLGIHPSTHEIVIKALDVNRGENTTSCSVDCSGPENIMTLNYRYLLDGLNACGGEKVCLQMIDASNPCLIKPVGHEGEYQYILMPIRQQ